MALFKNVTEIKKYIPVSFGEDITKVLPDIEWAEEMYIIPTIGRAQYDDLNDEYNKTTPALTDAQASLLKKVQMPLILFAYSKAFIVNQVLIDGAGVSIVSEQNRKTAFQWQIEELREDYAVEKAYNGLDFLLAFLEENKSDYPLWVDSDAYSVTKQFFINNTADFNRFVNIGMSRRTFMALWQLINSVEELQLEGVLGKSFFADLKAKILAGTLSADEKNLVSKIQPVLAYLVASEAIYELPMRIRAGSLVLDSLKAGTGNIKDRNIPKSSDQDAFADKQRERGMNYLGRLKDYLQETASPTVFPIFYNSSLYIHPEARQETYTNRPNSGQFLL